MKVLPECDSGVKWAWSSEHSVVAVLMMAVSVSTGKKTSCTSKYSRLFRSHSVSQPLPFTLQCGAAGGLEHSLAQAGACAWVIAANWSISDSISGHPLSPALGLSKCAYALPEKSQAFHSLPIIPTGPPSRQGGLSSLCQTPGLWCPIFWVKPLTPQERYLPTLHV